MPSLVSCWLCTPGQVLPCIMSTTVTLLTSLSSSLSLELSWCLSCSFTLLVVNLP